MTREKALLEVKMYQSNDWNLDGETPEYFILKKNTSTVGGHILVFILTFWFSLGLGNLVYYLASKKTKKLIK